MRKLALVLSAAALMTSTTAWAKLGIDAESGAGITGNYIFRGARLANFGVYGDLNGRYNINPRLSVDGYVWAYALTNTFGFVERNYDLSASYTPSWMNDMFTFTAGWTYFDNGNKPGGPLVLDDSGEAYGVLALNRPKLWSPWISAHYDYNPDRAVASALKTAAMRGVGMYIQVGAGRSFDLSSGWVADVSAKAGFDFGRVALVNKGSDVGKNLDGYRDGVIHAGLTWQLEKDLTFGPSADLWIPSSRVDPASAGRVRFVPSLNFNYTRTW